MMVRMDDNLRFTKILFEDFRKYFKIKSLFYVVLYPIICIVMFYFFVMDYNAVEFYSRSNTFKQTFIVFGVFISIFLPFLITTSISNIYSIDVKSSKELRDLQIQYYKNLISKIIITIVITTLSLLILLALVATQIWYLNKFDSLILNFDYDVLNKLISYTLLLPILILPFVVLIMLIRTKTQNTFLAYILPLILCLIGNSLVISKSEFIEFSPLNTPMTISEPMFSNSAFDYSNSFIIIGICIASIMVLSYLIVMRGMSKV